MKFKNLKNLIASFSATSFLGVVISSTLFAANTENNPIVTCKIPVSLVANWYANEVRSIIHGGHVDFSLVQVSNDPLRGDALAYEKIVTKAKTNTGNPVPEAVKVLEQISVATAESEGKKYHAVSYSPYDDNVWASAFTLIFPAPNQSGDTKVKGTFMPMARGAEFLGDTRPVAVDCDLFQ